MIYSPSVPRPEHAHLRPRSLMSIMYHFRHRIIGPVVVVWLLLMVASVLLREIVSNRVTNSMEAWAEATQLGESLDRVFSSLQDAETSQRGFLLTGNETYLEPFRNTEASLSTDFNQLAALAMQDRLLQNDVLKLRGLTELKMAEMKESIKIRREKNLSAAIAHVNTGKGKETMDQIRAVVKRLRQQRLSIFSSAGEATRGHLEFAQLITLIAGCLSIGAGLLGLYLVRIGYLQEKSQRQLLEEKLRAEKIIVEKSAFLANMSHEIRTPMNAILGFGELLEGEPLTPKQAQYLSAIRQSGTSLLQLINDILDLSKIEAGKMELHLEPTDMRELFGFLETIFGQQAMAKSIQLKFDAAALPHALLLDRLRLRQVLVNLVGNAVKFTNHGHVHLQAAWHPKEDDRSKGALVIDVEDTGIGISTEQRDEIFKPFVQSNPSHDGENQGTGLGLHIVQRLTEMMGGEVALESTLGKGSVFRVHVSDVSISARLPVSDILEPDRAVDFNDFEQSTLLVVDDNEINRSLIAGIFEQAHHQLFFASNGKEALARIQKNKPHVVLLDIRMPVMDGLATLAEIRKLAGFELLPVIAVTASSQSGDERDLRVRFNGYIRKPFSRQTLHRELAQFLPQAPKKNDFGGNRLDAGLPPDSIMAKRADNWEAVIAELRVLEENEWPALRDSLAINETQCFARKLRALGQSAHCDALIDYADKLAAHAAAYAIHDLEKQISVFPSLVQTIGNTPVTT